MARARARGRATRKTKNEEEIVKNFKKKRAEEKTNRKQMRNKN